MKKAILVVAAHPDDEVLGCGGTIALLKKQGYTAYTLILGEGKTSRPQYHAKKSPNKISSLNDLKKEALKANTILGVKTVYFADLPDNKFDTVSLLSVAQIIEKYKEKLKPEIIFTHHFGDLNIDHQITYQAVLTATRPMAKECVKDIFSFEVPSSTEWNLGNRAKSFQPNVFFDISSTIAIKIKAMAAYHSELKNYPHPRSLQHIKELAKVNGTKVGLNYSENFHLIRSIRSI